MSSYNEIEAKPMQKKLEEVISSVKGVVSCNVVVNGEEIEEVHVLAVSSRSPKQVVRDVESAAMAQLNVILDHRKISVAQTKDSAPSSNYNRLIIDSVEVKGCRNWLYSKVFLRLGENVYEGSAEGPDSGLNRYKLLASATTKAVEEILGKKALLVVEEFSWQTLADFEVGIVVLSCVSDNKTDTVVGACLAKKGKDMATVKAVLDALNRKLDVIY